MGRDGEAKREPRQRAPMGRDTKGRDREAARPRGTNSEMANCARCTGGCTAANYGSGSYSAARYGSGAASTGGGIAATAARAQAAQTV